MTFLPALIKQCQPQLITHITGLCRKSAAPFTCPSGWIYPVRSMAQSVPSVKGGSSKLPFLKKLPLP